MDRLENKFLCFSVFILALFLKSEGQTVVLSQNFEGAWTTIGTTTNGSTSTLPSGAPANTPVSQIWTANNSSGSGNVVWHRDDYSTGWASTNDICTGAYPPPSCGANSTSYSALFDDYDATSGTWGSIQSPTINLAAYSSASLTFYYTNFNSTAKLNVQFWNGTSWIDVTGSPLSVTSTNAWQLETVSVPASCLINGSILKFTATSDYGFYPIGIDEISLTGCSVPTTQASFLVFSGTTCAATTLNWTNGNGVKRIVVAKAGGNPAGTPANGTDYTANTLFGIGGSIAPGEYVVYNGIGSSVTVTGLISGTTYGFKVFEYNCPGNDGYLTSISGNNPLTVSTGAGGPVITTQPSNQTICSNSSAIFTVATSSGSPSYQWQSSTDGTTWANTVNGTPAGVTYSNSTIASLTVAVTTAIPTYYYRCIITAAGCAGNSTAGTLTMNASPTASAGVNKAYCNGSNAAIGGAPSASGGTSPYVYSWSPATGLSSTAVANPTCSNTSSQIYTLTVTDANACTSQSTVTVSVYVVPTISSQPVNASDCIAGTVSYSVVAAGGALGYQWQESQNGGVTWNSLSNFVSGCSDSYSGVTTSTMTVTAISAKNNNYQYRCIVSNPCGSITSASALATVNPLPISSYPYTQNFDGSICGWSFQDANADGYAFYVVNTINAKSASDAAVYVKNPNGTTAANDWFYTPELSLTAGVNYIVNFWYRTNATHPESFALKYGTPECFQSTQIFNFSGTQATYALGTASLSPPSTGLYNMGFYCYSAANEDSLYIDNFSISTCAPPSIQASAFTTSAITQNSMIASWTRGNGNNVLVIAQAGSPVSTDPTSGIIYTGNSAYGLGTPVGSGFVVYTGPSTSPSVSLTGLSPGTTYYFSVYEYSSTGPCYLVPGLTGNATTLCLSPYTYASLPYSQDFESWINDPCNNGISRSPDLHWRGATGGNPVNTFDYLHRYDFTTGDWTGLVNATGGFAPTFSHGAFSARFRNDYSTAGTQGMLDLFVDLSPAGVKTITFDYSHNEAWQANYSFDVLLSTDGGNTFPTSLLHIGNASPAMVFPSTQTISTSLGNATSVLRFMFTDKGIVDAGIDNLNISLPCTEPTTQASINAYTNNNTGNSVTVNWTRGNGTGGVLVLARLTSSSAFDPTSGTTYTANPAFGSGSTTGAGNFVVYTGTGNSVNVSGLTSGLSYTFTVYEYNTLGTCYDIPGSSSSVVPASCNTVQTFLANGNWTVPAGVTSITVYDWGGGGGGGGGLTGAEFANGGGGGGGACSKNIVAVVSGTTYTLTIGAGGLGGAAGAPGIAGGTTTVTGPAGTFTAGGGAGGLGSSGLGGMHVGGAGGVAGTGTVYSGGGGSAGNDGTSSTTGITGTGGGGGGSGGNGTTPLSACLVTGTGGAGTYPGGNGGYNPDCNTTTDISGIAGNVPAGGGSGDNSWLTNQIGGNGGSGQVMIVYCPPPTINSTSPGTVCGSGTVVLSATASGGVINWYAAPTGGVSLGSGNSFTTPFLFATTTYYIDATTCCTSASRTAITATVNPIPVITAMNNGPLCNGQTLNLISTITGGPATFSWTGPNAFISSLQNPSIFAATSLNTGTYTVTGISALSGCSSGPTTTAVIVGPVNGGPGTWTWTGVQDNNWFNCFNWDKNCLPDLSGDVVIPSGTPNYPVVSGGAANCNTITINSSTGATLNVNSGAGGILNIAQ